MIIAQKLNGQKIKNHSIVSRILPVDYSKVEQEITDSIKLFHPDLVVGLGVAHFLQTKTTALNVEPDTGKIEAIIQ